MSDATPHRDPDPSIPPAEFGDDQIAWATWLYFGEGHTQNEVAQTLRVSRATIANYIAEARRRGLVTVNIRPDLLAGVQMGRDLARRFGISGAHIIPSRPGESEHEVRRRLGLATAEVLAPRLSQSLTLGVAWGRTMLAVAEALPEQALPGLRVLQVAGSSLAEDRYSPEFCTTLIARRLGAHCENLHAPAILTSRAMRDALVAEPGIARQLSRLGDCDLVLFGVGGLEPSVVFSDPQLLTREIIGTYIASGGISVILGRILDASGAEIGGPLSGRQIGMELDALRAVPERIAVAGGPSKVAAIRAMLAGRYATQLVTDSETARRLLGE